MVVWSSPSVKQLTVAADHRCEEPQFCFLHSDDVSSDLNPCLLQAPKQLSAFVLGKKSEHQNLAKGTISLSKQIRQQLDVQPGDKLNVSFPTATGCKNIVLQPITDNSGESDWYGKFVEPFFKRDCLPYPVHNNTVVEMVNSEGERQDFMVYEINNKTESFLGFVDKNTNINVCGTFSPQNYDKMRRRIGFADLGGVDNAIDQIRIMVEIPLTDPDIFETIGVEPSYGILLHGPSGTGKTTIAKAVADEIGVFIHVINGPEIIGKHAGEAEENIRKAFEICQQQTSAILFIDEIDAIAPKRDKAQSDLEKRVVSQLLASMDGVSGRGRVAVLAATNRPNALDPALRRYGRFDKEIEIGVPDQKARLKILQIKTKRMTGVFADGVDLEEIAAKSHGYVGADLAALVTDAGHRCAMRIRNEIRSSPTERQKILRNARVTKEDFEVSMEKMSPSALRETLVETPKVEWDAIGGLDEVKKNIQEMIQFPIQHAEKYEKFGTPPSRGVLFYGPPGCGKTLLAKAAATMCGANFISVKGPELLTMWLGESEANVRELFDRARGAAPCILFFDEIDSIAPKRGSGDSGGATDRIINQLLTELDGIGQKKNVFIIGATNRPDCMDNAILRPGRLDQLIYIPLPDKLGRLQILRANLGIDVKTGENKKGIIDPDVDLEFLAEFSNGYSGADLADICCRAVKCAISEEIETGDKVDRLTRAHFESVMMDARMSVKEEDIRRFEIMVNTYTRKESATIFKFPEASSSAQNGYQNGSESEDDYS